MDFSEYEREGRAAYAALATTVAAILRAAIGEEGYRLQQVKERAKTTTSLLRKLDQRGIGATITLEDDIKDLAGCRVIFYTNSDVTRFINSGIIDQNFEVLEVKVHHPQRAVEDATELYISNHYLVRLGPERVALPEYARFAGMRCEIQIQTILNHAWAEMAHDTIYKAPLHPYTQALISAVPIPDPEVESKRERVVLKGDVPSPMTPPPGCRFHTRCPVAEERCKVEVPALLPVLRDGQADDKHLVACHLVKRAGA